MFVVLTPKPQHSHTLQLNYVKPAYGNITCPGDPCLTLEAYVEAVDEYFMSDVQFLFIPGDHYFDAHLRLVNISNVHFKGEDISADTSTIQISYSPLANLTFVASSNVTFSHLTFTLGGSWTGFSELFSTMVFQSSFSLYLSNLTFLGSRSSFGSTAIRCHSSHIEMSDIHIVGAKSILGAALVVYNSTVTLSGNNSFISNTAYIQGGAVVSLESNITISGRNYFEGNSVSFFGGAMFMQSTIIEFSGTTVFLHNRAVHALSHGGAVALDNCMMNFNSGGLYFTENSAQFVGGAMYISSTTAQMTGQIVVQGTITANSGAIRVDSYSVIVCVGKILFSNNSALVGGALSLSNGSQMILSNATFEKNFANFTGGALHLALSSFMIIEDSLMVGNHAQGIGGTIGLSSSSLQFTGNNYIKHSMCLQSGGIDAFMSRLNFSGHNYFINNTSSGFGGGLSLTFTNASVQGTLNFSINSGRQGGAVYGISSRIDFDQYADVTFESNIATIQGGAIYSVDSIWNIKGTHKLYKNSATVGGAMSLSGDTKLALNKYTEITYRENHADTNGGAIFFADAISINQCRVDERNSVAFCFKPNSTAIQLCRRLSDCFIELRADVPFDASTSNISIAFVNNFAGKSGTAIFGGSIDNCRLYLGGGLHDDCGNKIGREYSENPLQIMFEISTIDNLTSAVSSEPYRVCFCDNGVPNCELNVTIDTVRGKQFTLSAVTVGQGNYTVPSSVKADFNGNTSAQLSQLQRVQDTGSTCTDIVYRLFTAETFITMVLFPDGPCRDTGIARRQVNVTLLQCPDGFVDIGTECVCDKRLNAFSTTCNVDTDSIVRVENNFWLMALYENSSYRGLLLHQDRCPFDFCVETAVGIKLDNSDVQCNHNHSGIVCGSCQDNFSLALGSLHCLSCSNTHLALILPFALAGLALVAILLLLQLTVAVGTMNSLIFYANVVQVNRDIFFPPGVTNTLTVFIAWLNLDLGIETCFYDGMDAYAFIWLQFIFPFYVLFLIGIIIFLSHYSKAVSRSLGSNPVSVLATLLLLSYSKILRTVISILSRTSVQYPDGSYQYVWLYDGNVPYFSRADHIALGVFAIFALLVLFLPYTILLFCGHWLQAYSHWWILSWINKIKPFLDAYHAPYKKESRYWTGFLLLVRCVLFLTFAFNALGSASINLLTISSIMIGVAALAWLQSRLYEKIHNDILEALSILNLCIFAAATYHVKETGGTQAKLAYISVGIVFLTFIGVVLYHVYLRLRKPGLLLWKRMHPVDSQQGSEEESVYTDDNNSSSPSVPTTTIELREPLLEK